MKRTPLKAGKPLVRNTALRASAPLQSRTGLRRTPLAQVSAKRAAALKVAGKAVRSTFAPARPKPAVPAKVRKALAARSGGMCEIQRDGCLGWAVDPAHRIARGMGGRHGTAEVEASRLSVLLHSCRACHEWTHDHPAASHEAGWFVHDGDDPTAQPVLYRGVRRFLDDAGGMSRVRPEAAAR